MNKISSLWPALSYDDIHINQQNFIASKTLNFGQCRIDINCKQYEYKYKSTFKDTG